MSETRHLPARVKAVLLLITGLAIGAWYSYGIASGSKSAYPQHRQIFEIMMLLTFVWMLIWTLARRAHGAHNDRFWALALSVYAAEMTPPPASREYPSIIKGLEELPDLFDVHA